MFVYRLVLCSCEVVRTHTAIFLKHYTLHTTDFILHTTEAKLCKNRKLCWATWRLQAVRKLNGSTRQFHAAVQRDLHWSGAKVTVVARWRWLGRFLASVVPLSAMAVGNVAYKEAVATTDEPSAGYVGKGAALAAAKRVFIARSKGHGKHSVSDGGKDGSMDGSNGKSSFSACEDVGEPGNSRTDPTTVTL